ncbi:MAG: hypothetical protein ABII64_02615 [Elusimicrobiota bacterium]
MRKNEVVAKCDHLRVLKYSSQLPYVFTEHGVAMLSSILNSERAIQVNIHIMRAFVKMKEYLPNYREIAGKIGELEKKVTIHDDNMKNIFISLRYLTLNLPQKKKI